MQRDDLDLLRIEPAQVAVLDQVIRMPVMALVADVDADVVQQRAVLQPLALAIAELVHRPRLIEERQRQPRDLLRVVRPVAAALAQLDDAAAADVGVALDLADRRRVAVDVVEHQPFAEREVAERDVLGAEPAQELSSRTEPATAMSARRGSSPSMCSRGFEIASLSRFRIRCIAFADTRRLRSASPAAAPSSLSASAPRLRIVPDVPITRSKRLSAMVSR